ncbi:MAG TPA: hypothetical protein EYQ12_03055, partial [Oceanospirillaceae bacterium]|nr:hypothetical protein [Oceanospirillaceae bacterium]
MRIDFGTGPAHGFALLEVLLALGLSSVMLLVLYSAQRHSQAVLVYSQQLHHANQLMFQVASQVWAYPQHYQLLTSELNAGDAMCLAGRHCSPAAMTQAWATYWHQHPLQQLPQADLTVTCIEKNNFRVIKKGSLYGPSAVLADVLIEYIAILFRH